MLAFGIPGVCRGDELTKLTINNVNCNVDDIVMKITDTRTKETKVFVVDGEFVNIIREYMKLRPNDDKFYCLTLEAITNNELSDRSWKQASLPLAFAGLGIRKLVNLAHSAYFASVYQSQLLSNQILAKLNICNAS